MTTKEQREEWRRLEQAATPGEWAARPRGIVHCGLVSVDLEPGIGVVHVYRNKNDALRRNNAAFIAAARTAVPLLLAQVEALEADAALLDWIDADWPDIESSFECCEIFRLEPTQGEHRVFSGKNIREAGRKAMSAPPFTGMKIPEWRQRTGELHKRIAELEAEVLRLNEIVGGYEVHDWQLESPAFRYVDVQVDKEDYLAARKALEGK